jgi:hypothetical protein
MKVYAVRDKTTGELIKGLTSSNKRLWEKRHFAEQAIRNSAWIIRRKAQDNYEVAEFMLVEPEDYSKLKNTIANLHNELCERCGRYLNAHKGACDGCRWKGIE